MEAYDLNLRLTAERIPVHWLNSGWVRRSLFTTQQGEGTALHDPLGYLLILLLISLSCATPAKFAPEVAERQDSIKPLVTSIEAKTIIPRSFDRQPISLDPSHLVKIPKQLLSAAMIVRPRAELRMGPGSTFDLLDSILEENDKVMIFDTIGVWSKIVSLRLGIGGWVHKKVLALDESAPDSNIEVATKLLPTVIAIEAVTHMYSYGDLAKIPVRIGKGSQFIALRKIGGRTLVWLADTNSVAWISEEQVK